MTEDIKNLERTERISSLKEKTFSFPRYMSVEQARIITRVYQENPALSLPLKRAKALAASLIEMPISIDTEELVVGNRTPGIRAGVVFPEAGISWISKELDTLPSRPQDPFQVREADKKIFQEEIEPYWSGKTMEDHIYGTWGEELKAIEKVVKINQKDHAQGHICPHVETWLNSGPAGLLKKAREALQDATPQQKEFYQSVCLAQEGAIRFIRRYAQKADSLAEKEQDPAAKGNLEEIGKACSRLAESPPQTFREALQSTWFLFVILHMESNASSFSPGRMDQYLHPYLEKDLEDGILDLEGALELIDALY